MAKNILVLGGAGYIGTACVKLLSETGHRVTVVDDLSTGQRKFLPNSVAFYELNILERERFLKVLQGQKFDVLLNFAARKDAGESMKNAPLYSENIRVMINALDAMVQLQIPQIIFSSSAFVYGDEYCDAISEDCPTKTINYYGWTKLACEDLLRWYAQVHDIQYTILRYFNVVGDIGLHYPDAHSQNLFPIIQRVLSGAQEKLEIYGDDYPTCDGTCVRDYVHITDIAEAHLQVLERGESDLFNLGSEKGYSVQEVIEEFEKQTKRAIPQKVVARRKGDPAQLLADSKKARKVLNWRAKRSLSDMVHSALEAHRLI